jgi:hypothetical protein
MAAAITSTTSARVLAPLATAAPKRVVAPSVAAPAHHRIHREPRQSSLPVWAAPSEAAAPAESAIAPLVAAPSAAPSANAAPSDPSELFDQRK